MVHVWWGQTRCILGPDHPFCCASMQFCCACNKSGPFWTRPRRSSARFYLKFQSRLRLIRGWNARRIFQETHQGGKCCANFIWDLSIHLTSAALSYLHGISGATMVPLLCRLCHSGYVHRILWLVKGLLHWFLFRKNGWTVCSWESVCNFSWFHLISCYKMATKWEKWFFRRDRLGIQFSHDLQQITGNITLHKPVEDCLFVFFASTAAADFHCFYAHEVQIFFYPQSQANFRRCKQFKPW